MTSQKPAIVIAHGAWHVPAHYEPMAKPLREAGYEVIVPKHQSIGRDSDPGNALQKDAAAVADILRQQLSSGKDVILVMHSYGGISGSDAVGMLYEGQNGAPGPGRLLRLVYLAAHILPKGEAFLGSGRSVPNIEKNENGMTMHMKPYERYYHEVSPEDAEPAIGLLERMAHSAFVSPTSYAGWKDYGIPCTFIKCSKDTAVTMSMCDTYISRLEEAGVEVDVEIVDAGHCAHFTAPSGVVGVIEELS